MKDKWNGIVDFYNINKNASEQKVQALWELIFSECFGYSKLYGDIGSRMSLFLGSHERLIPDIILKKDNKNLFVVELKQHNYSFREEYEKQLFSYLKQIKCDVGVLICDKIYIYYFDYSKNDEQQLKCCIDFKKDNEDGYKFVELFSKHTFNKDNIIKFIEEKNKSINILKEIQKELTDDFVKDIVKDFFYKVYGEKATENALKDYTFKVVNNKNEPIIYGGKGEPFPPPPPPPPTGKPDVIKKLRDMGYTEVSSRNTTYACCNTYTFYPANVNVNRLEEDWFFILDDCKRHQCHCLKIPANTFKVADFKVRPDKGTLVIYINYEDPYFEEKYSHKSFKEFIFTTFTY